MALPIQDETDCTALVQELSKICDQYNAAMSALDDGAQFKALTDLYREADASRRYALFAYVAMTAIAAAMDRGAA